MKGQVSVPLGRGTHDSKRSAIASWSLEKRFSWEDVGNLAQERLVMRLASAQRMEADRLGAEVHLAPDQAVGPEGIRLEGAPEQTHGARLRGAPDEDHHPLGPPLQIRLPGSRKQTPRGRGRDAGGGALTVGADVAPGALLGVGERIVVEARPDLGSLLRAVGRRRASPAVSPYATNGGMDGISTCWALTSRTPGTPRATSSASSMAAVPSRVTVPAFASTVMRYLRVLGWVASATWTREASERSATSCAPAPEVCTSGRRATPATTSTAAATESFSVLRTTP